MTEIEKNAVKDIVMMAETYASIYEPRYRAMAKNAFMDGMTFLNLMRDKTIEPEQMNEEICRKVRETTERIIQEGY